MASDNLLPGEELNADTAKVAANLAHEGVPIRAIARALKQSTDAVREAINEAVSRGSIVSAPKEDWTATVSKDNRSPELLKPKVNEEDLTRSLKRMFKVTPLQAALLGVLLTKDQVSKDMLHQVIEARRKHKAEETDPKMVDVVICNLRKKVKPYGVLVVTIWSCGYYMEPALRKKVLGLVMSYLAGDFDPASLLQGAANG